MKELLVFKSAIISCPTSQTSVAIFSSCMYKTVFFLSLETTLCTLLLAMCLMDTMGKGWPSRQCERVTGCYFIFSTLFKLGLGTKHPPYKAYRVS
jgi:hypothetical protein